MSAPGQLLEHQHGIQPPHARAAEFRPGVDAAESKRAKCLERRSVHPPFAVPVPGVRSQALVGDSGGSVDHQPLFVAQWEQSPCRCLCHVIPGHCAARLACFACPACPVQA